MKNGKLLDYEEAVVVRYRKAVRKTEKNLCCPVEYDPHYLEVIPREILEKDYGCGDPSQFVKEGETVLDLGCGAGKICYIAAQIVGRHGRVIGVDFNEEMLALARRYQGTISRRIGYRNVEFKRGRIQDLQTGLDREESPLIRSESIDVIVSNCVLNLVRPADKKELFREMHRVLKRGGRVAISDIVSDETVPELLQRDPKLWSGCLSGAFQEKAFLEAFEEAGFYGIQIEKRGEKPWRVIRGIEFRSLTVTAFKGKEGPCWERNQAVIYKGPWKQVEDDDRHILRRGIRTAVCAKTFQIFSKEPYRGDVILVPPRREIPLTKAKPFSAINRGGSATQSGGDCSRTPERDPRETKGRRYRKTTTTDSECTPGTCC